MANISAFHQKQLLDWGLGGASPTQATARYAALATQAPTSAAINEVPVGSGYTRVTVLFAPASSPIGSATNSAALTFGPFSSANIPIVGLLVMDERTANGNNILWYGNLATARTAQVGDSLVVAAGALIISIA